MDLITCDFETFYGDGYTLSGKEMTTEAYVRDIRFESILLSTKINNAPAIWTPRDRIAEHLEQLQIEKHAVIMHHAHFDGLIANFHYGRRPKLFIDTLGMGRALHGAQGKGHLSLEQLAIKYGVGVKGKEVLLVRNKRYQDFSPQELARYGAYSCQDSDLTYAIACRMLPQFDKAEIEIHDHIIRMFTEPVFELDTDLLTGYVKMIGAEKATLMMRAQVQKTELMSNPKFAEELRKLGVEPPVKISPAYLKKSLEEQAQDPTHGVTFAFAKTDPGMQALQEHPDERVQILVEARLKNKTTIAEKGGQRLIRMAGRGLATVYLKYSGASGTHRLAGGDRFNWQAMKRNDPTLPANVVQLRNTVMAPEGQAIIVGDSSTIEARLLDWLAGQDDMVEVYRKADAKTGPDMYCIIAERIYKRPISKAKDPLERQFGKTTKLGLGFGMGADKFVLAVRGQAKEADGSPKIISRAFSQEVVDIYREAHPQVKKLWSRAEDCLKMIQQGICGTALDYQGIVKTCKDGLIMPNGLKILFPDLKFEKDSRRGWGGEWTFWNGKAREHIYGPKVVENVVQCLARIIVFEQCRRTAKIVKGVAKWAHSVHDEGIFVSHMFEAPWVMDTLTEQMRVPLWWCESLPLNSEGGFNRRYGHAKS